MRERRLQLSDYGIDKQRYLELLAICRQYDKYKRMDAKLHRGEVDRGRWRAGEWRAPDPTGNLAVSLADNRYSSRARAIEEAAAEAGGELAPYIIRNTAREIPYERMGVPCGRRQFFAARRAFFVALDRRV